LRNSFLSRSRTTPTNPDASESYLNHPEDLDNPALYFDLTRERIEPFLYRFSESELSAFSSDESWRDFRDDPLLVVTEAASAEGPLWQQTCVPMRVLAHARTLDSVWKSFAAFFGGSMALLEDVNWNDPLEGAWLRRTGEAFQVHFERSFESGAHSTLPGGRLGLRKEL
jgi:hypothetical protein